MMVHFWAGRLDKSELLPVRWEEWQNEVNYYLHKLPALKNVLVKVEDHGIEAEVQIWVSEDSLKHIWLCHETTQDRKKVRVEVAKLIYKPWLSFLSCQTDQAQLS